MNTSHKVIPASYIKQAMSHYQAFQKALFKISSKMKFDQLEHKQVVAKVMKGNEAFVTSELNKAARLKAFSKALGVELKSFELIFDHHGADAVFKTAHGKTIPVEIKTTQGNIVQARSTQRRPTNTKFNLNFSAGFKFHYTDDNSASKMDTEIEDYRNGQLLLMIGLYSVAGQLKLSDIFLLKGDNAADMLLDIRSSKKVRTTISISPTELISDGKLSKYVDLAWHNKNIEDWDHE